MLPTRTDAVLVTGVTGFVGTAIILRILERSDRPIIALVRATDRTDAAARVRAALADVVPHAASLDTYMSRVTAVPADLLADGLGLRFADREDLAYRCDEVLHCAAAVSFELPLDAARAVNAAGAARVAELATRCAGRGAGLRRIVHVSTAYVAGERLGVFGEDDVTLSHPFRNTYERTKHEAEQLLRAWTPRLPLQVVRPSIVVGERATGWTRSFNVLYWPLKMFARGRLPVVPAVSDAPVDVVPVDYVADVVLGLEGAPEGTYHAVAGRHASTVSEVIDLAAARFGVPEPAIVDPGVIEAALAEPMPEPQRRALEQARVYFPYFRLGVRFDDRWARSILEPSGVAAAPLASYFDTLMDFAQRAAWGRGALTVTSNGVTVGV
ncbi:MAG TPA: SDR family oxidoreductase [Baekduia sp.]|uniref:SDR family oxidoreductase n=1 Tax=Baekduia sp. TaxID=2600305 RepID=UPI002D783B11|nr:SDR family oxidoreductase [Baekduia sp.]HET6507295.1 SDR family oxidoreductase [Baekduia sp.]